MLIATPNLSLDITIRLARLRPGTVARATATDTSAGGKGVNVARAAMALGASPGSPDSCRPRTASGSSVLLAREGITFHPVAVDGVLRVASILLEDDGRVTVVNGRGPDVDPVALDAVRRAGRRARPGCPGADLFRLAAARSARTTATGSWSTSATGPAFR